MSNIDFNAEPYWDDFEATNGALDSNYMRILFRPGYAVQARELTQIQTIIQNQIKQFGNHIFQDGSPVTGGHLTLDTSAVYVKLEKQFNGTDIDLEDFIGTTVFNEQNPRTRARVIQTFSSSSDRTLIIKYLRGANFLTNQTLTSAVSGSQATVVSSAATGSGSVVSINDGVFYVGGFFIKVVPQTIVLDPYGTTPTYRVGLQIEEDIVTESDDTMLLDPAQDSFNYQAPGAHRYKYNLVLAKRALDSVDDSRFFELLRVENGVITRQVKYPVYSELEKTLARRTYDESGDYTVKPFRIHASANTPANETANATFLINVEPGKSYVRGHEYETIGTQKFTANRARTSKTNKDYSLSVLYGNSLKVTDVVGNTNGAGLTTNYTLLDIHTVPANNVKFGNTDVYFSSRIGTARLRNFDRSNVDVYDAHLVDIDFIPIIGIAKNQLVGNEFNQIQFPDNLTDTDGAYVGGTITILSGDAAGEFGIITDYVDRVATIDRQLTSEIVAGVKFSITVPISATKSIAIANTSNFASANLLANIAPYPYGKTASGSAFLQDNDFNSNVFELPNYYVTYNDFDNITIYKRNIYKAGVSSFNSSGIWEVTLGSSDGIFDFGPSGGGTVSDADVLDNIIVVATTAQSGGASRGSIVDITAGSAYASVSSDKKTLTIYSGVAATFNADVYVTVKISDIGSKTKTYKEANSALTLVGSQCVDTPSSATGVTGYTDVKLDLASGIAWYTTSNVISKTPEQKQSLYVSDVIRIKKIYDSGSLLYPPNTAPTNTSVDITDRYYFDSGQNDNFYDHGSISLKPGAQPPVGQTCVMFDYFLHSGSGLFAGNSYSSTLYTTEQIPIYKSKNGKTYNLRDCIDLRPSRLDGTNAAPYVLVPLNATVNTVISTANLTANTNRTQNVISPPIVSGTMIAVNGEYRIVTNIANSIALNVATRWTSSCTNGSISIVTSNVALDSGTYLQHPRESATLDYGYYLPRIDKVVVTKDREIKILTGSPSLTPQEPVEDDNSMAIYRLHIPAYTSSVDAIDLEFIDNKRYTMKDIGIIDQRVSKVEEYIKMKQSESDLLANPPRNASNTSAKPILGTLVDDYDDLGSADTTADFSASIENGKLTVYKYIVPFSLELANTTIARPLVHDKFISLAYTETSAVSQSFATPEANATVQTAVIGKFDGFVTLTPESDYFYSTEHQPSVTDAYGRMFQLVHNPIIGNPVYQGPPYTNVVAAAAFLSPYYTGYTIVGDSQPTTNNRFVSVPDYSVGYSSFEPNTTVNVPVTTSGAADVMNNQWFGYVPLDINNVNRYAAGFFNNTKLDVKH